MKLPYRISTHRFWYAFVCFLACERAGDLALQRVDVNGHPLTSGWLYGALTAVLFALAIFHAVAALKLETERLKARVSGWLA